MQAGVQFLQILKFSYLFYIVTTLLMAFLRSMEVVTISFYVSLMSLLLNVAINYTLIFGHFGFPELGLQGAAIGTLTARIMELLVVLSYVLFREKRIRLFSKNPFHRNAALSRDYRNVAVPIVLTNLLWSLATPIQTGILGHLSSDAIAATSVSTTMFQYLKVVTVSEASATSVSVGKMVGEGRNSKAELQPYVRALQLIFLLLGLVLGGILLAADDTGLTGLWFEGQKYFARTLDAVHQEQETAVLSEARRWLDVYFGGQEPDFTPPLHPAGSAFQQEVWALLRRIPCGQTTTYGALARQLAAERGLSRMSAQAVGGAVGHNVISIIIPCHRVVGANGSLTGYAGGIDKKAALLRLEMKMTL